MPVKKESAEPLQRPDLNHNRSNEEEQPNKFRTPEKAGTDKERFKLAPVSKKIGVPKVPIFKTKVEPERLGGGSLCSGDGAVQKVAVANGASPKRVPIPGQSNDQRSYEDDKIPAILRGAASREKLCPPPAKKRDRTPPPPVPIPPEVLNPGTKFSVHTSGHGVAMKRVDATVVSTSSSSSKRSTRCLACKGSSCSSCTRPHPPKLETRELSSSRLKRKSVSLNEVTKPVAGNKKSKSKEEPENNNDEKQSDAKKDLKVNGANKMGASAGPVSKDSVISKAHDATAEGGSGEKALAPASVNEPKMTDPLKTAQPPQYHKSAFWKYVDPHRPQPDPYPRKERHRGHKPDELHNYIEKQKRERREKELAEEQMKKEQLAKKRKQLEELEEKRRTNFKKQYQKPSLITTVPSNPSTHTHKTIPQPANPSVQKIVPHPANQSVQKIVPQPANQSVQKIVPQPAANPSVQKIVPQPAIQSTHKTTPQPANQSSVHKFPQSKGRPAEVLKSVMNIGHYSAPATLSAPRLMKHTTSSSLNRLSAPPSFASRHTAKLLQEFENFVKKQCIDFLQGEKLSPSLKQVEHKSVETTDSLNEMGKSDSSMSSNSTVVSVSVHHTPVKKSSHTAASKIQAVFRGYRVRKILKEARILPKDIVQTKKLLNLKFLERPFVLPKVPEKPYDFDSRFASTKISNLPCTPPNVTRRVLSQSPSVQSVDGSPAESVSRKSFNEPYPKEAIQKIQEAQVESSLSRRNSLSEMRKGPLFLNENITMRRCSLDPNTGGHGHGTDSPKRGALNVTRKSEGASNISRKAEGIDVPHSLSISAVLYEKLRNLENLQPEYRQTHDAASTTSDLMSEKDLSISTIRGSDKLDDPLNQNVSITDDYFGPSDSEVRKTRTSTPIQKPGRLRKKKSRGGVVSQPTSPDSDLSTTTVDTDQELNPESQQRESKSISTSDSKLGKTTSGSETLGKESSTTPVMTKSDLSVPIPALQLRYQAEQERLNVLQKALQATSGLEQAKRSPGAPVPTKEEIEEIAKKVAEQSVNLKMAELDRELYSNLIKQLEVSSINQVPLNNLQLEVAKCHKEAAIATSEMSKLFVELGKSLLEKEQSQLRAQPTQNQNVNLAAIVYAAVDEAQRLVADERRRRHAKKEELLKSIEQEPSSQISIPERKEAEKSVPEVSFHSEQYSESFISDEVSQSASFRETQDKKPTEIQDSIVEDENVSQIEQIEDLVSCSEIEAESVDLGEPQQVSAAEPSFSEQGSLQEVVEKFSVVEPSIQENESLQKAEEVEPEENVSISTKLDISDHIEVDQVLEKSDEVEEPEQLLSEKVSPHPESTEGLEDQASSVEVNENQVLQSHQQLEEVSEKTAPNDISIAKPDTSLADLDIASDDQFLKECQLSTLVDKLEEEPVGRQEDLVHSEGEAAISNLESIVDEIEAELSKSEIQSEVSDKSSRDTESHQPSDVAETASSLQVEIEENLAKEQDLSETSEKYSESFLSEGEKRTPDVAVEGQSMREEEGPKTADDYKSVESIEEQLDLEEEISFPEEQEQPSTSEREDLSELNEIVEKQKIVENEIRDLEAQLGSPIDDYLSALEERGSDLAVPRPPPPYYPPSFEAILQAIFSVSSTGESSAMWSSMITEQVDEMWDMWEESQELPDYKDSIEKELKEEGYSAVETEPDEAVLSTSTDEQNVDKFESNLIGSTGIFMLQTVRNHIRAALYYDELKTNEGFVDTCRRGMFALDALQHRIPKTKAQLIEAVQASVAKQFSPANSGLVRGNKWTCRETDEVEGVLVHENVKHDSQWVDIWPEVLLVCDQMSDDIVGTCVTDVLRNFEITHEDLNIEEPNADADPNQN